MDIEKVAGIIGRIAGGFEENCARCLDENKGVILDLVKEQLYTGHDGNENILSPSYDSDPFFNQPGRWYHRSYAYKAWKREITPPMKGAVLGLPARSDSTPNLFIDGTFYSEITATMRGKTLVTDPGNGNGPEILGKYGNDILNIGPTAKEFFNMYCMIPSIERFFKSCGWR